MNVEVVSFDEAVLTVKCSGTFGIGADGRACADRLTRVIERWQSSHPTQRIEQLDVDYAGVDYHWGDGPVASILPLLKSSITRVRLLANHDNYQSLLNLVTECGLPWFEVKGPNA